MVASRANSLGGFRWVDEELEFSPVEAIVRG
jgi:hypothetical protein